MRIPRMTTRRWIVVVMIVAVLLGVERTRRRAAYLQQRAVENEQAETAIKIILLPAPGTDVESLRRRADYYAHLKEKYRRAARSPWLSIEPDPPAPE